MLKRRKGYFLLVMLVLTGLAGRTHSDALSGKERRFLLNDLKITKNNLTETIKGLSRKQIDYRKTKEDVSIREYIYRITTAQIIFWRNTQKSLQTSPTKKNTALDDLEFISLLKTNLNKNSNLYSGKVHFHSTEEAVSDFNKDNAKIVRYVRTATDNLKDYIIRTPLGNLNMYQTIILLSGYTKQTIDRIEEIKQGKSFPKQ